MAEGWRFFATRVLGDGTEETIGAGFPVQNATVNLELSGPGGISGEISPELEQLIDTDGSHVFDAWATAVYAELDGHIIGGGLILDPQHQAQTLFLDAPGHTVYPEGRPYLHMQSFIRQDPLDLYRYIWNYIQGQKRSNLGITMDGTVSPIRVGTEVNPDDNSAGPYKLMFFDTPNLGAKLDELADTTPFDYLMTHFWEGETIRHHIRLGYPRLGRRLQGPSAPRFVVGENIVDEPKFDVGDRAASADQVLVLGAGTGSEIIRAGATRSGSTGLSRPVVYTDSTITTNAQAQRVADELVGNRPPSRISELRVSQHPNAPIGSYSVGDEILFQSEDTFEGEVTAWVRIEEIEIDCETDESRLVVSMAKG